MNKGIKVALYTGTTDKNGHKVHNLSELVEEYKHHISLATGGCTTLYANGAWFSDSQNKMISEESIVFTTNTTEDMLSKLQAISTDMAQSFNQECILIEVMQIQFDFV